MGGELIYRQFRAPQEHGGLLIDPTPERIGVALKGNIEQRAAQNAQVVDRDLAELASEARRDLLHSAFENTRSYRDVAMPDLAAPLLMAGHQGGLYHPGVWFKNFLLDSLACRHGATALSLIMDSDLSRSTSVRVPSGPVENPTVSTLPFDQSAELVPGEEQRLVDHSLWESFGRRAARQVKSLVPNPLVTQLWPIVLENDMAQLSIGEALARARHRTEGEWGMNSLEITLSRVVDTQTFRWFTLHFLDKLSSIHEIYNRSLHGYRSLHRIRNRAQPAPDLMIDNEWLEAPFWMWTHDNLHRRRLFARRRSKGIEITDRAGFARILPSIDQNSELAIETMAQWAKQGVKIRPRALTATLYARLFLSDLFIHGIGGAKYDQITDLLIERIFGTPPLSYVVASATMHLPVQRSRVESGDLTQVRQALRVLRFHPEKHLQRVKNLEDAEVASHIASLVSTKLDWIQTELPRGERRQRHRGIEVVNLRFQPFLTDQREALLESERRISSELRREEILGSREFSFVLFSEEELRRCLLESRAAVL